jgi:hypothetical protein
MLEFRPDEDLSMELSKPGVAIRVLERAEGRKEFRFSELDLQPFC